MGRGMMTEKELYPEEQMQIEKVAIEAFLFASDYGRYGIDHLIRELNGLKERLDDYERDIDSDDIELYITSNEVREQK
jgi:hypothetical protein